MGPEKRAAVDKFLALLPLGECGHVADCGFDDAETCGCYTLPERIAAALDAHVAAALNEAADAIEVEARQDATTANQRATYRHVVRITRNLAANPKHPGPRADH